MLNLLDGLRDMKAPLASGLVVLFALWLAFANQIADVEPGDSVAGNIRQLAEYIGVPATLGIVAFIAYLLGLLLSLQKVVLGTVVALFSRPTYMALPRETGSRFVSYVVELTSRAAIRGVPESDIYSALNPEPGYGQAKETGQEAMDRAFAKSIQKPMISDQAARFQALLVEVAIDALGRDQNLLAAQLQTKNEKTYEQYEKARSEGEFRAALVLPLVMVVAVAWYRLFFNEGLPVAVAVGVLVVTIPAGLRLGSTATTRVKEANQILVTALILGHIELPALTAVKDLSAGQLPARRATNWPRGRKRRL